MAKFVTSQLEIGNVGPINLDEVITFEKYTYQQIEEGDPKRHQIMFIRNETSVGPRYIYWKYNTECDRNKDYESLIANHTMILGINN